MVPPGGGMVSREQTRVCKNITFPQLRGQAVMNGKTSVFRFSYSFVLVSSRGYLMT